jgi:monolysocardiolipin acyltransferase
LNENGWIHLFPEGKVNCGPSLLKFRWGVARLIRECKEPPLVLPFYHRGMGEILPLKEYKKGFNLNKDLKVLFGDLIDFEDFEDLREQGGCEDKRRIEIMNLLEQRFLELKQKGDLEFNKVDRLH